ncbi:GMC oxidoreductase [Rhypophila decipiens]|uniref:GMC oxidoreductase n=1 Tax=Rhypophila decipiens TaxID=261697 RepID=A0AAN6XU15_9PEZI|nr:GMC oxidoreductase [Rhypophila decipiens]
MFTALLAAGLSTALVVAAAPPGGRNHSNTYDYIVVGSGPGGVPVASHLSRKGYSVLLLEAGDDQRQNPNTTIGSNFLLATEDENARWDFFVRYHAEDEIAHAHDYFTWRRSDGSYHVGREGPADDPGASRLGIYYPRSGTLGGCSMHNAGASVKPQNSFWDGIANLTGDDSWNHTNMQRYFEQFENNTYLSQGTPGHGFDGWLQLSTPNPEAYMSRLNQSAQLTVVQKIAETFGHGTSQMDLMSRMRADVNSVDPGRDEQEGMFTFPWHHTPLNNRTNANFLLDVALAEGAPLTIQLESFVTKILFDSRSINKTRSTNPPRAIGVEYHRGKSLYRADPRSSSSSSSSQLVKSQAYARREVIISAGVFNTPQLLKLSGIGPALELRSFNIPLLVDAPGVGANLQDDWEISLAANSANPDITLPSHPQASQCRRGQADDPCAEMWLNGTGPYAAPPSPPYLMQLKSNAELERHDLTMWNQQPEIFRGFFPGFSQPQGDLDSTFSFAMVKHHTMQSGTGRPSGGTVKLRSADPFDVPEIFFDAFNEDRGGIDDLQAMYEGVQFGRSVLAELHDDDAVGPFTEFQPCGGESTKAFIRRQVYSHHASSTAAIGADGDLWAVLDSQFRVSGTRGLRVVDGSALPWVPSPFPIIGQFMASLKAAEVILADAERGEDGC